MKAFRPKLKYNDFYQCLACDLNFSLPKKSVAQKQQYIDENSTVKENKENSGIEIRLTHLIINSIDEVRRTQINLRLLWR
jgi:hypothetical protein